MTQFDETTPVVWWKSNTLKALLLAIIAKVLEMSGATEAVANAQAVELTTYALQFLAIGADVYAFYSRSKHPTPPLTLTTPKEQK